jgi:acyl-CoA thioester hydrolase
MAATEFRHPLRVRYRECDQQGHVFFSEYAAYLDVAINELWRERAGGWQAMVDGGSDIVVGELQVRYLGSARFDELIDVVLCVEQIGTTSLTTAWRVERDGDVLVTGTVRYVCIDPQTHAKKPLPDDLRAALAT